MVLGDKCRGPHHYQGFALRRWGRVKNKPLRTKRNEGRFPGSEALELAIHNRRFVQSAIENRQSTIRELCGEVVQESGRERAEGLYPRRRDRSSRVRVGSTTGAQWAYKPGC